MLLSLLCPRPNERVGQACAVFLFIGLRNIKNAEYLKLDFRNECPDSISVSLFVRYSASTFIACQDISFLCLVQYSLLSFACPKERSKEKGRQNELLRSFCHSSRTSCRTTGSPHSLVTGAFSSRNFSLHVGLRCELNRPLLAHSEGATSRLHSAIGKLS